MMISVGFHLEEQAEQWARERLGLQDAPEFFRAMSAVDENNDFVFVVVMTNFSSTNVDLNIAADKNKITPKGMVKLFNDVFSYLFDKMHVRRVTGLTTSTNLKAQRIIEHFGFKLEGVMRKAARGAEDLMVYGFLAEEYQDHAWRRN